MFCCMLLALSSHKERKQRLIIHHVLNIILSEFLPSSVHSSCWMQDAKSRRNIRLSKKHHSIVFSSQIFRLGSFSIYFFHFFICSFIFPYLQTLKTTFPPSIKGFQSSQGVWKHLFGSFHLSAHFLPFTIYFCFLNLKIPKLIF